MNNLKKFSLLLTMCLPLLTFAKLPQYEAYITQFQDIALQEMERTGIPASIKMAQAILESGAGTSTLALKANNHFGIKCGGSWKGKTHYRKDDDYNANGKLIPSCFRKYKSAEESFYAHSEFLLKNRRYGNLFLLDKDDYYGWAKGLKAAGYATSKTYASKLINLIEEYDLHLLDTGVKTGEEILASNDLIPVPPAGPITNPSVQEEINEPSLQTQTEPTRVEEPAIVSVEGVLAMVSINDVKSVKARKGDTPQSIAEAMNSNAGRLVRYNEFLEFANQELEGGERVYLQPKRASYRGKRKHHFIKEGETMFDISQMYALRLSKLYHRNRLDPGTEPKVGSRIALRGPRVKPNQKPRASFPGNRKPIQVPNFKFDKEKNTDAIVASTDENFSNFKPSTSFSERKKEEKPNLPWYAEEGILKEDKKEPLFEEASIESNRPRVIHNGQADNEEYTGNVAQVDDLPQEQREPDIEFVQEELISNPNPEPVTRPEPVTIESPAVYHEVKKGETLYRISVNSGISVEELKALNGLSSNIISVGQLLRID